MRALLLSTLFIALALPATAQRRGSIYDSARGALRPLANKTAHSVGDLVTVVIQETQDVKNEEKADLSKSSDLNFELLDYDIKPNTFGTPLPSIETGKEDSFTGNAKYEKRGAFSARLTAIVMDTLPNGNLVIQGRRELRIDKEIKVIEFSGIVRRYDITATNTVQSELVADARVTYSGSGPLTNATNRRGLSGWLHDALDWIWPF
jgi:flagellar L-ring protein precursor FlgH